LPDAVESCLDQTYRNIEIIVVNDGSPDNTSEVARKYQVKLVEKENGGLSSARNAGIKVAKGKYILTLDADDKICSTFIEKCLEADDDIVSTMQQEFGDSNNLWWGGMEHPKYEDFKEHNRINCCSLFLKEIWEDIGGYDENMRVGYEDWDFWIRATKEAYAVTVVQEPLFFYRKHGKSMVDSAWSKHDEIINYIKAKNNF